MLNLINKYNNSLPDERIDKLINKYILENNIFDYKNIAEFGIKNIDINNKLNNKDIFEFSKIGCEIMKYINSEITYSTLFLFMMGFQISKKRKFLSNQTKYLIDKYMDNELFDLDEKHYEDKKRFDSFGFGKRQCVAKGWINKIYERIILNIINKYNVEVCYIEKIY